MPVVCDPAERTLSNGVIEVRIDTSGHVVSLRRAGASHEIVAAPLNQLVIVRERTMDDEVAASGSEGVQGIVWSSAESKRRVKWRIGEQHPLRAELVLERRIGEASTIEQTFRLDAGSPRLEIRSRVEWREGGCTLRADFPVGLEDATLTCGERACHAAGVARDVIQQQEAVREERMCDWIDVSRPGLGCTILAGNGCGCSCEGSSIAVSLLRTPLHVDSDANDVEHAFAYAVMPHEGDWHVAGVVAEAESMRRPLRGFALEARAEGVESAESTIDVFTPIRVVPDEGFGSGRMTIESIRRSADDARLIVQVRECQDASSRAALSFAFDIAEIAIVDALGRAADDAGTLSKADVPTLTLGPLQTVTLAITPADRTLRV
ncbi:MAG: glycoside hydrolase family 38 C-terminal domain-containing protein [Phycisphaerales bacterium]|nr:glycoside hydrolase family 38 C-terminal domain-containing protein [Phycisphaerales bacterium]